VAEDETSANTERLARLEDVVQQIKDSVSALVAGRGPAAPAHTAAGEVTNARLEPQTVEEQVAAALAAKDKQAKEAALHEDVASLKEATAALAEKPPEPPQRRVEKVMGWGR
jgi:heme oxygenase